MRHLSTIKATSYKRGRWFREQLKKYFKELMNKEINLNGEYYVSMVYYLYKREGLRVYVPEIKYFCQWGTPEDLEEYEAWSRLILKRNTISEIPKNREIKIPWSKDSIKFEKSFTYWYNYFGGEGK